MKLTFGPLDKEELACLWLEHTGEWVAAYGGHSLHRPGPPYLTLTRCDDGYLLEIADSIEDI